MLSNTGIYRFNYTPEDRLDIGTVCVSGLPRSGTSMVASSLFHLGVFLGEKSIPPTYEDETLKFAFDKGDSKEFSDIVNRYSEAHDLWAFKLPRTTYRLNDAISPLNDPALIVTFRDPLSIELRKSLSQGNSNLFKGMAGTVKAYARLLNDLSKLELPVLMLAYDKVVTKPEILVNEIAFIIGIRDQELISSAINKVKSDKKEYLDKARVNKTYGVVESFEGRRLTGWAIHQFPHDKERPVIEIVAGKDVVQRQEVYIERKDLLRLQKNDVEKRGINPLYLQRNLRKFSSVVGFDITIEIEMHGELSLRVQGDHNPFYKFVISE